MQETAAEQEEVHGVLGDREQWQAWVRKNPERVGRLAKLLGLELQREGTPSRAELLDFCLEEMPEAVTGVIDAATTNPVACRLLDERAEAVGQAWAAKHGSGWVGFERRCQALLVGWLSAPRSAESFAGNALRYFSERFEDAAAAPGVYGAFVLEVARVAKNGDADELSLRSDWMSPDDLVAVLRAVASKPRLWHRVMAQLVDQATPAGVAAIAELLGDDKLGTSTLFWLACMGVRGVEAARQRWASADGASAEIAQGHLERLSSLPEPVVPPRHGGPRRRLFDGGDLARAWHPEPPSLPTDASEPTLSLERLREVYFNTLDRDLLSREEWADFLQVASLDERLDNPERAWTLARDHGLLGRGANQTMILSAAWRIDPLPPFFHQGPANRGFDWGSLLRWAGADAATFAAAAACVAARGKVLDWSKGWPSEADDPLTEWLSRLHSHQPLIGPAERPLEDGECWDPRRHDLVATIPAKGCCTLQIGEQRVKLSPAEGQLELDGPLQGHRRFPPVNKPLTLSLIDSDGEPVLGFGGITWGKFHPASNCSVQGVVEATLHHGSAEHWTEIGDAIAKQSHAFASLCRRGGEVAHPVALMAHLLPKSDATRALVSMLASEVAPYAEVLKLPTGRAEPKHQTYEAVLKALDKHFSKKKGVLSLKKHPWRWPKKRSRRDGELLGPVVRLVEGESELPSAQELLSLCLDCPFYVERGDEQAQLTTGDQLGTRWIAWSRMESEWSESQPLATSLEAMAWRVEEGIAVAFWNGFEVSKPERLAGLPFLPIA